MKWIEKRAEFQKKFDELSQENIQGLITDLNKAVGSFIQKGGLSQDPNNNPDYKTILNLTKRAENIKQRYQILNDHILKFLSDESKNNDLVILLRENGELQKQINRLEKIQNEMKIDVISAVARDELLRSKDTDVTRHQLFLFDKPVKKGSVPYLWVLTVLFIGIGLIIFKMTFPSFGMGAPGVEGGEPFWMLLWGFISNKIVLVSLLVSAIIVILFLSLKIAGVFGK